MFVNRNGFYIPLQRPLKKSIMPQQNHHYFASNLSLIRFVFLMNTLRIPHEFFHLPSPFETSVFYKVCGQFGLFFGKGCFFS